MYIDTHTHITWGIDDGIQTLNECIEVLHQCEEDGIERVIASVRRCVASTSRIAPIPRRQQTSSRCIAIPFNLIYYRIPLSI